MHTKIIKILLVLISLFFECNIAFAIDLIECNYILGSEGESGLKISYDGVNSNIIIDYEKYKKTTGYWNYILLKGGSEIYSTSEIEIDQEIFKNQYGDYGCPSPLKVCDYTEYSLNLFSFLSLGDLVMGAMELKYAPYNKESLDESLEKANDEGWAFITFDRKTLYILNDAEYKNSDVKEYINGKFSSELVDSIIEGYNNCSGNSEEWYEIALGGVCGIGNLAFSGIIGDTLFGDGIKVIYYKKSDCREVYYKGNYIPFNVNCGRLQNKFNSYNNEIQNYKTCDSGSCKLTSISNLNSIEKDLKSFCNNLTKTLDYKDGEKACIDDCMNLNKLLNAKKNEAGLNVNINDFNECGFSDRLIYWIVNIFKWVKYIVPVIVILMGLIDFMRAIATDKDDGLKKAQGRFIRRIIAAALIFIVPFILEFVIEKMGFIAEGCGIIDL